MKRRCWRAGSRVAAWPPLRSRRSRRRTRRSGCRPYRSAPAAASRRIAPAADAARLVRAGRGRQCAFGQLERPEATDLEPGQVPYDGRFVFARLRYTEGVSPDELGGGRIFGRRGRGGQGPPWSHDYPRAERNFMKILEEITDARSVHGPGRRRIVDIGSPELFRYPVSYMAEAGLLDADRRGGREPARLPAEGRLHDLRRLPRERLDELRDADEARAAGRAHGRARPLASDLPLVLRHRDARLPAVLRPRQAALHRRVPRQRPERSGCCSSRTTTTTSASTWEYSDTGWTPIDLSNEAYKLGVNYIIYGDDALRSSGPALGSGARQDRSANAGRRTSASARPPREETL